MCGREGWEGGRVQLNCGRLDIDRMIKNQSQGFSPAGEGQGEGEQGRDTGQ